MRARVGAVARRDAPTGVPSDSRFTWASSQANASAGRSAQPVESPIESLERSATVVRSRGVGFGEGHRHRELAANFGLQIGDSARLAHIGAYRLEQRQTSG